MATRRQFLGSSVLGALAAALIPGSSPVPAAASESRAAPAPNADYRRYITMAAAAQATPDFDA